MFKAIWRYVRAFGYLLTGRINQARQSLSLNPHVIEATYDEITENKTARVQQLKGAVARLIAQKSDKEQRYKKIVEDIKKHEDLKTGAASKAKKLLLTLNNDVNAARQNTEYTKCETAFKDFSSTLKELEKNAEEIEDSLTTLNGSIEQNKLSLEQQLREIERLKEEKSTAVAEVINAKEEEEIADMLNGISADDSSKKLQELRDLRNQAKAKAQISRELAGVDVKKQENEFLAYAENSEANAEFEKLLGLAAPKIEVVSVKTDEAVK